MLTPQPSGLSNRALRATVVGLEQMLDQALETLTYIGVEQPDPQKAIDAANDTLRELGADV